MPIEPSSSAATRDNRKRNFKGLAEKRNRNLDDHSECGVDEHLMPNDLAELHCSVEKQLNSQDQRYTKARRRVVEVLYRSDRPLTLPEIVASDDELAQSSTYRNLDLLVQVDTVERVISSHDHTHFELSQKLIGHHHHLICVDCGLILDIEVADKLEVLISEHLNHVAKEYGFTVSGHQLDVEGQCGNCLSQ